MRPLTFHTAVLVWGAAVLLSCLAPTVHGQQTAYEALLTAEYTSAFGRVREQLSDVAYYSFFGNTTFLRGPLVTSFSTAQRRQRRGLHIINGCSAFVPNEAQSEKWIAFLVRGGCRFASKAYNAARAGASGVIIMNTVNGDPPQMAGDVYRIEAAASIPSVAVSLNTGNYLAQLIEQHSSITLEMKPGKQADEKKEELISAKWILGHVVVFAGTIMVVSLVVLVVYYHHMRRARREERRETQHAEQVLERLPTRRFSSALELANLPDPEDAPTCAVCLDNFDDGEEIRVLPCKHEFHQHCVDPWLSSHHTCPLCKDDIMNVDVNTLPPPQPRASVAAIAVDTITEEDENQDSEAGSGQQQDEADEPIETGAASAAAANDGQGAFAGPDTVVVRLETDLSGTPAESVVDSDDMHSVDFGNDSHHELQPLGGDEAAAASNADASGYLTIEASRFT